MSKESKIERLNGAINWLRSSRIILSQAEFAEKIGAKPSQISEMLKGKRPISERTIHNVVDSFPDLNFEWLFRGEGEMIKKPEPPMEDPAQNVSEIVSMPREVWDAITARDRRIDEILDRMKVKDDQVDRMIAKIDARDEKIDAVISLLKEQIKKGEDAAGQGHAARTAAQG